MRNSYKIATIRREEGGARSKLTAGRITMAHLYIADNTGIT